MTTPPAFRKLILDMLEKSKGIVTDETPGTMEDYFLVTCGEYEIIMQQMSSIAFAAIQRCKVCEGGKECAHCLAASIQMTELSQKFLSEAVFLIAVSSKKAPHLYDTMLRALGVQGH